MISIVEGNIFNLLENNSVLIHQTNCMGVMGAGIAKTVKYKFPETFKKYKKLCDSLLYMEKKGLLGTILYTDESYYGKKIYIANCFGQFRYGRDERQTNYDALQKCFEEVKKNICTEQKIFIPYKIGCCNAGGDWNIVLKLITESFKDYNVFLVKFDKYK